MRSLAPALAAALAATAFPSCGAEERARAQPEPQERKELRIQLEVVEGRGGATLALIPVEINGEGPFPFALDTGASESVVDSEVARELGIERRGRTRAQGVGGPAAGFEIAIRHWRAGDVKLPGQRIMMVDLPEDRRGDGLRGLLGSDVLNQYDVVTIDYDKEVLVLRPRAE